MVTRKYLLADSKYKSHYQYRYALSLKKLRQKKSPLVAGFLVSAS